MTRTSGNRIGTLVGLAVMIAAAIWLIGRERHFADWVDDDAFISMRYARNLAEGHGLVFNPGERVEGYTNLLWTLLLTAGHKMGFDLPATARVLGGVFSLLTLAVLLLFNRTQLMRGRAAEARVALPLQLTAVLVVASSEAWAAWAVGGLENVLSGLLVALSFWLYFSYLDTQSARRLGWCALTLSLAVLNHPTSVLFAAVVAAHLATRALRAADQRSALLRFVVVFAAVVGAHTVWRLLYYGELLPNTYYAKSGWAVAVLLRGLRYFSEISSSFAFGYAVVAGAGVLLLMRRVKSEPMALLVTSILGYSLYILAVGGEEFPAYRSMVVLVPLLALLVQASLLRILERLRFFGDTPSAARQALSWVVVAAVVAANALPLYANERVRRLDEAVRLDRTGLSVTAAMTLKRLLPADVVFAHSGAGLIAYYTNFRWIDTLGLTDHHIARTRVPNPGKGAAGHEKGDGAYVWSRKPDYIMFPGYPISDPRPGTKGGRELFAIPAFHTTYQPVRLAFRFKGPSDDVPREHFLHLYERRDSAAARRRR